MGEKQGPYSVHKDINRQLCICTVDEIFVQFKLCIRMRTFTCTNSFFPLKSITKHQGFYVKLNCINCV